MTKIRLLMIASLLALGAQSAFADPVPFSSPVAAPGDPYGPTAAEIAAAHQQLSLALLDGSSAQFQDIRMYRFGKAPVFCGFVNAKNSFGGYTGFAPFYLMVGVPPVLHNPSIPMDRYMEAIRKLCVNPSFPLVSVPNF